MTKAEAGRKGGSVRSERKSAAARRTLAAARLAQARKLLGIPAPPSLPLIAGKDADANAS
jgi:hypothetical protein